MDAAITVLGTALVVSVGALIRHMIVDAAQAAKTRQALKDLRARVKKLDDIDSNGED